MKVEATGIVMMGVCAVETERCVAKAPSPITAVWTMPGRNQINVCRACLDEQLRHGRWVIEGARSVALR